MQDDIFRLDISVNDLARVQLVYRLTDLPHDPGYFGLRHGLQFFKLFKQLPAHGEFHQQIDVYSVVKEPVHSDDVRVVQETLNLELSDKLLSDIFFPEKLLLYYFDGDDEVGLLFLCQEDVPILPSPQLLNLLEVVDTILFLLFFAPGLFYPFSCGVVVCAILLYFTPLHAPITAAERAFQGWDGTLGHSGFL